MTLQTKKFLILDDQLVLRKLISRQASFFSRYAVNIDEFSDPAEALRSISEGGYHLIITDIGMPGMNGIDFIKNVARLGYHSALLIISGYDGKTLQTIADMAGSLGLDKARFLSKPYSSEAFVTMLNNIFNDMESEQPAGAVDIEALFTDICSDNFQLELAPIQNLADHRQVGFAVDSVIYASSQHYRIESLLNLLASRRGASAAALETLVDRMVKLLSSRQRQSPEDDCWMNIRINQACLAADNVFDHCFVLLQQYGVPAHRIGFELADGLSAGADALCYENIAKIKYLGFRLIADDFGLGSLTVNNMLKLPFDHVNVPVATLSWMKLMQGEDPQAFRMLRSYGLAPTALTATGIADQEGCLLAQAMGCTRGQGRYLSLPVPESEWLQARAGQPLVAGQASGVESGGAIV